MKDLNQWKKAVQIHLAAIETLLENIFEEPWALEVIQIKTGNTKEAEQHIKEADKIIRFVEKNFQSEIFFGFNDSWANALADQLLSSSAKEAPVVDELTVEFSTVITRVITSALAESGVEIEATVFESLEEENLSRSFNLQHYFRAKLQADPDGNSDSQLPSLDFRIAVAHPDKGTVTDLASKFISGNPFMDERYRETVTRFARHIDMASDKNDNNNHNAEISMKGQKVEFEDFGKSKGAKSTREVRNIDLLKDVEMHLSVELGRRQMPLGNILQLVKGSVIELEKLAGEPVEILVNGHKIAQGDVVVIDEHFGVRISNLLASQERIKELQ